MNEKAPDMTMMANAPTWKWEWNINTLVLLIGLISGVAAWGATWERVKAGQLANDRELNQLEVRIGVVEATARQLDNHELRLTGVERQVSDAGAAMRALESSINALASDIRVTREIVQRIEAAQSGVQRRP